VVSIDTSPSFSSHFVVARAIFAHNVEAILASCAVQEFSRNDDEPAIAENVLVLATRAFYALEASENAIFSHRLRTFS
jgi:hypothetical protein